MKRPQTMTPKWRASLERARLAKLEAAKKRGSFWASEAARKKSAQTGRMNLIKHGDRGRFISAKARFKPPAGGDPIVVQTLQILHQYPAYGHAIVRKAGISWYTVRRMRNRRGGCNLASVAALLGAMGYELAIKPRRED